MKKAIIFLGTVLLLAACSNNGSGSTTNTDSTVTDSINHMRDTSIHSLADSVLRSPTDTSKH